MSNSEHEPVIEVEEMGCIDVPEGQTPPQPQPQSKTVKQVLAEDVYILRGMNFTMDEVEKFGMVFAKINQDLKACIEALDRAEKEAKKNGDNNPE